MAKQRCPNPRCEGGMAVVPCLYCKGTGDRDGIKCRFCHGSGEKEELCRICRGSGFVEAAEIPERLRQAQREEQAQRDRIAAEEAEKATLEAAKLTPEYKRFSQSFHCYICGKVANPMMKDNKPDYTRFWGLGQCSECRRWICAAHTAKGTPPGELLCPAHAK